ncbi:hypothetical protein TWF730_004806 [Orbilia blumenaviensis]|uniref:Abscission/NoCut checkpoint regulator n=1 Tax=Orbilia blumenaviensis TaxID=1796055 RepID=A0AAV9TZZ3_9PEZI
MGDDDNLAKRFESIFSKKPVANSGWDKAATSTLSNNASHDADLSWQDTEEASLEDLLGELGAEDTSWIEEAKTLSIEGKQAGKLDKDDSSAVNKLLAEARERLKAQSQEDKSREKAISLETSAKVDDHDDKAANSDDEADEVLRQIQDSLSVEEILDDKTGSKGAGQEPPQATEDEDGADDELAKRFAALEKLELPPPPKDIPSSSLDLPGVPTSQPGAKGKKKTVTQKVDDLMDDIENWCCICNEDAVVKCLGCDGDLYCNECFNEGHRGKDAPYDMKQHKALAYNKKKPMAA